MCPTFLNFLDNLHKTEKPSLHTSSGHPIKAAWCTHMDLHPLVILHTISCYTLNTAVHTAHFAHCCIKLHSDQRSLPGQRDEVLRCHLDPLDRYAHHLHPDDDDDDDDDLL